MVAVADRCCRSTRERGPSCHVFVDAQGYDGGCGCCPTRAGLDVNGSYGDARQGLQLLLLTDIKESYYMQSQTISVSSSNRLGSSA